MEARGVSLSLMDVEEANQPVFLTRVEVAEILRISPGTLVNWHVQGIGPPYLKINGGKAIYSKAELFAWIDHQSR